MASATIKNPFGDNSIDISATEEDNDNSKLTSKTTTEYEGDYIQKELKKKGINEETINFGLNMGKQLVQNSKFVDYFSLDFLKPYFRINNKYVLIKFRYLFLPFLKEKQVISESIEEGNNIFNFHYLDLYIPIMSFITYVLFVNFMTALHNPQIFNPQILGRVLSKDLSIYIINGLVMKLLMFIFVNKPLTLTDLLALSGYKFLYMIIFGIFSNFNISKTIIYGIFILLAILSALFSRRVLNIKLGDEKYKNTIVYSCLAADFCAMFLMIFL